jgi:hypothetical protein
MMKKYLLIFCCIASAYLQAGAQTTTKVALLKSASVEKKATEDANYEKALKLAKEKGWDLVLTSKNGTKAYLVGLFEDGLPNYYTTYNNTIAAATTRANQLWNGGASGLNLSGSSANMKDKLAIWDGGKVLTTHVELAGRITQKDAPSSFSDHATHVTGTMIATGINPIVKGMAYGLQGIWAYDFSNDISEITAAAASLVLSNHSYGIVSGWYYNTAPNDGTAARWEFRGRSTDNEDYKFGYYDAVSKQMDDIAYNAPNYLIVKSAGNNRDNNGPVVGAAYYRYNASNIMAAAGNRPASLSSNDGYDILPTSSTAKNILTIGAVNGISAGYTKPADIVMSTFSNWGPTDDGRIKPDIVADGVSVTSSVASGNSDYASMSGTSMAAPNTTGSLLLLQEYYSQLKAGAFMRSATLKGLAIHTAEEAGDAVGPDYRFGWGLLNVEKGAAVIKAAVTSNNAATSEHLLYENVLANNGTFTKTVIASGKGQLSATICWTDVSGNVTPSASALNDRTIKLVNDLDIRITKGSSTYFPWILDPNVPTAAAAKGNNIRDNVERVNIDSVVPGQVYTITISHRGTLSGGSQAYSLLVSGVGGTATCTSAATSSVGTRIDNVNFSTIVNTTTTGCTTYKDFTTLTADVEPNAALPLSVKVNSCDGTNANKIVKVFIDYNSNGVFTDAGELVATSGLLTNGNTFSTSITTPAGLLTGNYATMRVIAQETSNTNDLQPCGTYANGETQDYRIRFIAPANDIAVTEIVTPITGSSSNAGQLIAVRLKNNGITDKANVPLTATVLNGSTIVTSINVICPIVVPAGGSIVYTFQKTFNAVAATTYSIAASATASGDQDANNNILTNSIAIAAKPAAPVATGVICSASSATFRVTNPVAGVSYFWYNSPTATTPIGTGSTLNLSVAPASNTVYVESGARGGVGIKSKNEYPSDGAYQNPGGNYMKYSATTPLLLESVRLFTRYPGTLNLNLYNIAAESTTGYSYYDLGTTPINVYSSHPTPLAGAIIGNDVVDTGAIYYVGLSLPSTGAAVSYALRMSGTDASVNVFRNNNLSQTTNLYPFTSPVGLLSLTGNSVQASSTASTYPTFYYYFYDMKFKTLENVSERAAIVGTVASAPTVTIIGAASDSLQTNALTNIQWYVGGNVINGANSTKYKPLISGNYTVTGTDANGCTKTSSGLQFTVVNLPLTLTSFSAQQSSTQTVMLNWQTTNEVNSSHVTIERSIDASKFTAIGKVAAKGGGDYSFNDNLTITSTLPATIYYRLKIVDKDGSFTHSQVLAVQINSKTASGLSVFPNPVTTYLKAQVISSKIEIATLQITDLQGKVLQQQPITLQLGLNSFDINVAQLAKGSYIVVIRGEQVYQKRIMKE